MAKHEYIVNVVCMEKSMPKGHGDTELLRYSCLYVVIMLNMWGMVLKLTNHKYKHTSK